jgi:CHAT domain-containing protein
LSRGLKAFVRSLSTYMVPPTFEVDSFVNAYEVAGRDLHQTQLVNLTACDTGGGDVTPEGVAGLRQAFLSAGARSVTTAIWSVPAYEIVQLTMARSLLRKPTVDIYTPI